MRFAYEIVLSALESVATEIKLYNSGIGIGIIFAPSTFKNTLPALDRISYSAGN